jgi:hypothetical protein
MDYYRHRLKVALWNWREGRSHHENRHADRFRKDRMSGRRDKRAARQQERREIETEN